MSKFHIEGDDLHHTSKCGHYSSPFTYLYVLVTVLCPSKPKCDGFLSVNDIRIIKKCQLNAKKHMNNNYKY